MTNRRDSSRFFQASCKSMDKLLGSFLFGRILPIEQKAIENHCVHCSSCAKKWSDCLAMAESGKCDVGFRSAAAISLPAAAAAILTSRHPNSAKVARAPISGRLTGLGGLWDESRSLERSDKRGQKQKLVAVAPAEKKGFLDALVEDMGAASWWMVSGAFHALLIMLVSLISLAVLMVDGEENLLHVGIDPVRVERTFPKAVLPTFQHEPVPLKNVEAAMFNEIRAAALPEAVEMEQADMAVSEAEMAGEPGEDGGQDALLDGALTAEALGIFGAGSLKPEAHLGLGGQGGSRGPGRTRGGGLAYYGKPDSKSMDAFQRSADPSQRLKKALANGGNKNTEKAVDLALEWLARHQEPDGRWSCRNNEGSRDHDWGITGLATLAFLGGGHSEKVGPYKKNVQQAIAWIVSQQRADGAIGYQDEKFGYHHSICGLALAEAFGMSQIERTKEAAQKALDWSTEHHQAGTPGNKFGWRYQPRDAEGDLSNTGWFILQLKSAKVCGLKLNPDSIEGALRYLDARQAATPVHNNPQGAVIMGPHRYSYKTRKDWNNTTAIGILCRMFTGTPPREVQGAAEDLMQAEPLRWSGDLGRGVDNFPFPLYYTYYGTLAMFQIGGQTWERWNGDMQKLLLPNQRTDDAFRGSWDPLSMHEKEAGRAYTTAMGAMCLEVFYRYLPIYR